MAQTAEFDPIAAEPLPPIRTDMETAREDMEAFGFCRFGGAVSEADLEEARQRLDAQAAGEEAAGVAWRDSGLTAETYRQGPNQRVWNLINKGEVFRRMATNAVMTELLAMMLGDSFILSSFTANIARQGGALGGLHTDQMFSPAETPYALVANCLWMLDDFTPENGATSIIPGSHKFGRWPQFSEAADRRVPAVGPAGALLVFDGRLWHGTGANTTDRPRRALLAYACLPFVRQQENFAMSVAPEVLDQCSDELKARLGFKVWGTLGGVEGSQHGTLNPRPERFVTELGA